MIPNAEVISRWVLSCSVAGVALVSSNVLYQGISLGFVQILRVIVGARSISEPA